MYDQSVIVFERYLKRLSAMMNRLETFADTASKQKAILQTSLAPNMFPLVQQVRTTISFSLRTCYPLAGLEIPEIESREDTIADLRRQIKEAGRYLQALPANDFATAAEREIVTKAGFKELRLDGETFLTQYALPNFFFHLSMVYAILRYCGAPVGKGDFDGFHEYPPGFAF
ncbi:uncharacterized protein conserved in bacteria [Hahella chejuensis KCTC 2396]|uniref:Uncharacterized protein conserved in bacteria n=1 Tax=Hahella chejuensis (strain KCTC 2396) TaxID=349521 RepID=Q2SJI4_HAHCH|nr:DUF1993 domain-containing protein [Hahella chejuensis]ABC29190.1 uncharacterized protein conserved in bacteria [Hahella chejuensis KCTC 2396]